MGFQSVLRITLPSPLSLVSCFQAPLPKYREKEMQVLGLQAAQSQMVLEGAGADCGAPTPAGGVCRVSCSGSAQPAESRLFVPPPGQPSAGLSALPLGVQGLSLPAGCLCWVCWVGGSQKEM